MRQGSWNIICSLKEYIISTYHCITYISAILCFYFVMHLIFQLPWCNGKWTYYISAILCFYVHFVMHLIFQFIVCFYFRCFVWSTCNTPNLLVDIKTRDKLQFEYQISRRRFEPSELISTLQRLNRINREYLFRY